MTNSKPAARRHVPQRGMQVSLADIMVVHIAVFGKQMPDTLPFVKAGEMIREARPVDWQDLMTTSMSERLRNPDLPYERIAAIVTSIHGTRYSATPSTNRLTP